MASETRNEQSTTVSIISYNCRGAMASAAYIDVLMQDCDILCIQEHHLFYEHREFLTTLNRNFTGYVKVCDENHPLSLIKRRKGGLAVMWRKQLDFCVTNIDLPINSDRFMVVKISPQNTAPIFIVNAYLPSTNMSIYDYRESITEWNIILEWLSISGVVISCGDFNGQLGPQWGNRAGQKTNVRGTTLGQFLRDNQLLSTVSHSSCSGPIYTCIPGNTEISPSQLDHFIIDKQCMSRCTQCFVFEEQALNSSDHLPIYLNFTCNLIQFRPSMKFKGYDWNKCDIQKYSQALRGNLSMDTDYVINNEADIDEYAGHIQRAIISAMDTCVPQRVYKPYVRPFWDNDLRSLHKEQLVQRQIWLRDGKPRGMHFNSYYQYKKAKRLFSKTFEKKQLAYYQEQYELVERQTNTDMKTLWKQIRRNNAPSSTSSISHEGTQYNSPHELCKLWRSHFNGLLNEQKEETDLYDAEHLNYLHQKIEQIRSISNESDDATGTLTDKFTVNDIANACKNLPNNKAAGYDSISYESVKQGGHQLFVDLTRLFNTIVKYTHIPQCFKHSVIIPLHKGRNKPKDSVSSYRGVSLTPILNKVFEKLILNRLKPWLSQHDFPPPLQQAGRGKTNCVCLSYAVQEAIRHAVHQGSKVYGCFLDIKSAYDVINWHGLLVKLWELGIRDKLWHLFANWLYGSTACVSVQGNRSGNFEISRSIKQGGLLSTFYFVVFYNDIHSAVKKGATQALTFNDKDLSSPTMADDTLLLSMTVRGLQTMISNAYSYANLWRLTYSPSKSKCIIFSKKKKHMKSPKFYLGDQMLEIVTSYNYLGIILSSDLSTAMRSDTMAKKGYKNLGALKASGFFSNGLTPITCSGVWQRMVIPSMLYGCEVWGSLPKRELGAFEVVQNRVGKHIQGLHKRTHSEIVRGLLGWVSIARTIDQCKLNFLYKLMSLPDENVIKFIFLIQMSRIITGDNLGTSISMDLWTIATAYQVTDSIIQFFQGEPLFPKTTWKRRISEAIHKAEIQTWSDGLKRKGADRFLRIHNCVTPSPIYRIIRDNIRIRKYLQNTIRLLAFPEHVQNYQCHLCHQFVTDVVSHRIMYCQELVQERNTSWDIILNSIDCRSEARLLGSDDNMFLDTLLSRHWDLFSKNSDYNNFICIVALELPNLMFVV